jgi:hypothetical protein
MEFKTNLHLIQDIKIRIYVVSSFLEPECSAPPVPAQSWNIIMDQFYPPPVETTYEFLEDPS